MWEKSNKLNVIVSKEGNELKAFSNLPGIVLVSRDERDPRGPADIADGGSVLVG